MEDMATRQVSKAKTHLSEVIDRAGLLLRGPKVDDLFIDRKSDTGRDIFPFGYERLPLPNLSASHGEGAIIKAAIREGFKRIL